MSEAQRIADPLRLRRHHGWGGCSRYARGRSFAERAAQALASASAIASIRGWGFLNRAIPSGIVRSAISCTARGSMRERGFF
jgi:hypothetical protein